jgi:hypothetical protein
MFFELKVDISGPAFGEAEHSRRAALQQLLNNIAIEIGSGRPPAPIKDANSQIIGGYGFFGDEQ